MRHITVRSKQFDCHLSYPF